jgi:selenocysteine-specific translation elongation factor
VIDLTVSAADDEQGMTLGELRDALDRCLNSGADEDGPVRVNVDRAHRVRRVEVRFEQPALAGDGQPTPAPGS